MDEWKEVRRGVPAEEVPGVPDDAIDWANWTRGNQGVSIYQIERRDSQDRPFGQFYVVAIDPRGDTELVDGPVSEEEAYQVAEDLKAGSYFGF